MKIKNYHQQNHANSLRADSGALIRERFPWRPNYFSRITLFTLILWLCFAAIPAPVLAASPADFGLTSPTSGTIAQQLNHKADSVSENQNQEQSEIKQHVFKFYLDPALVPNMDFAKATLPKYVEDMNTILAKNTNRRLVFNPETDLLLINTQPHSNQAEPPLPVENFEIWAYAIHTNYSISYGGYAGIDGSGAGVLAGLKWTRLYDPDEITPAELTDYWTQTNNMLHELAHVFGAGIGEYYKLSSIQDATDVSPFLDINVLDPNDSFWSDKPDFMADPLLRNAVQTGGLEWLCPQGTCRSSREALLTFVKYSDLTATLISGNYRNTAPMIDLQHITVSVVTDSGAPLSDANIKIWSVVGGAPYQARLMVDAFTDSNGQASFAWPEGSINPHNNYDFLRLIKVYKDGYIASAKYISIFDADIVKLVGGSNLFNILIPLNTAGAPPILTSIVRASANPTSATSVDFTVTFSESVTGVDAADFTLTTTDVSDATVSGVSGSGATYTVSVTTGSSSTLRLDVVDDDTIVDLALNPLGGAGAGNGSYTSGETYDVRFYRIYLPLVFKY